jgi:hypothetical protein
MVRKTEENVIQRNSFLRNTVPVFVCNEKMAMECWQVSNREHEHEGER